MKKILLFAIACVLGLFGTLRAQDAVVETTFYYDFNDYVFDDWRTIDADGDGYKWGLNKLGILAGYEESYGLYSLCYADGDVLTPDNYVVTNKAFAITETSVLSFLHRESDGQYNQENFGVVVSEDGENFDVIWSKRYASDEVHADGVWAEENVSLAAYAGKNLYIGFRHYECDGNNANGIKVDNIKLSAEEGGEEPVEPELPTAPAAPQNLAATATSYNTVSLAWDAVEDATSYNVYQGETLLANVTEATFVVTGLDAETEYCFAVAAVNEAGASETSEPACATTGEFTGCYVVFTLGDSYGDGWGDNTLTVSYGDVSEVLTFMVASYSVKEYSKEYTLAIPTGAHVTVTYAASGSYAYPAENSFDIKYESGEEIHSVAAGGLSAAGYTYEFDVDCTPKAPAAPVVSAEANGETTIVLAWNAVGGAESYDVYQGTEVIAEGLTETTYTVEGLTAATEYCFAVTATNEVGTSEASEEVCATTFEVGTVIVSIGDGTISNLGAPVYNAGNGIIYSLSQQIFTAEEMNCEGGTIQSVSFHKAAGNNNVRNIVVYLQSVEKESFGGNYDWIALSDENIVYQGEFNFGLAEEWVTIELQNAFEYAGGNIALTVYDQTGTGLGYDYTLCDKFYSSQIAENRGMYYTKTAELDMTQISSYYGSYLNTGNWGNPANVSFINNVKFRVLTGGSQPVVAPAAPEVAAIGFDETTVILKWYAVEGATSYNVYQGETLLANVEGTTYTVEGLTAGTEYCFNVAAANEAGESEYTEACATTEAAEEDMNAELTYRMTGETGNMEVAYSYESEFTTKVVEVNAEGIIDSLVYNEKGQIVKVNTYMEQYDEETGEFTVVLGSSNEYTYNEAGQLATFNEYVDSWSGAYYSLTTVSYDSEGRMVTSATDEYQMDYTYNEEGLLAEAVMTYVYEGGETEVASKNVYTYENGNLVKVEYMYSDYEGGMSTDAEDVYEYDENGNCIAMISSEYGSPWTMVRYKHNNVPAENVYSFAYPHEILVTPVKPTHANMLTKVISYYPDEDGNFTEAFTTVSYSYEEYTEQETPEIPDDAAYLIRENFDGFTAGDKIAEKGSAWWTTWSKKPGSAEDGVVAELNGNKCGYMTYGVDQVLLLGGQQSGVYDLEFDILVPEGKSGYFNILHNFNGQNSTWAMQGYLHMTDDGGQTQSLAPGHGTVHAGGNSVADVACVYDEWMHFRLHIDTDADLAQYYYTAPGEEEVLVYEWQWSMDSFGENTVGRKLDAMNFYPPLATSAYYLDNFTLKKIGGESAPELKFNQESLSANIGKDDVTSVELSFENTGTSIAEYTAWVDYGMGEISETVNFVNYDVDPGNESIVTGLIIEEPTEIEIGAMYPATSYGNSVSGTYITHMQYLFAETTANSAIGIVEGSTVTFRIYGQGLYGQPGKVLAEKEVPYAEIGRSDWTTVEFDEPVALTGFNVWATVTFTQEVSTEEDPHLPFSFDGGEAAPYGDLFRVSSNSPFWRASEKFGEDYGNFHLHVVCMGEPVLGGWAELDKAEGVMPIGATETITVDLSTIGLKKGETYNANLVLSTNVPENETIEIPVSLYVWGENIEENLSDNYNIYPNPTSGQVVVEGENINYVAVYNTFGQLVKVVKTQNNVVDMSAYENGVYYFSIVDNAGQSSVQRVVVAK